ncbi:MULTISPECIES: bifunctional helix-turn-helix domain-containing protein/methylated-DNA--[protein]-cysteine S-methyltransferase [Pedobacter]|uniref:bifunctional helix-turn-helix domain-containing protein/methylated-DNA--[protein]-cysteine S-methyltransferase n=1 Tax=Pedobacter TaxID=84567 RepID=UPI00210D6228|nr:MULTISPECIES: methylated-DNA--[protein]-cysteine S-methyltransferase [unclassified Pedobacter]
MEQQALNYERIAAAIAFIKANFKTQPTLEEIAAHVHLSPYHFQKLFTDWAGTSPKKFLQYVSIGYAKSLLASGRPTLFTVASETGLSGTGRLHDLFVGIEGMTPAEYKMGGKSLQIRYSYAFTPFGQVIVASTTKGICFMAFHSDKQVAFEDLRSRFPNALYREGSDEHQQNALAIFHKDATLPQIKLHLKGTDFQLKVWDALLKIPASGVCSYGTLARQIDYPNASRAVGTAIGANPIAYLIPCHRVIQASGDTGGYMWGGIRKLAILAWEAGQLGEKSLY